MFVEEAMWGQDGAVSAHLPIVIRRSNLTLVRLGLFEYVRLHSNRKGRVHGANYRTLQPVHLLPESGASLLMHAVHWKQSA
jgi:hypothetical protein